jgi:tripartite ATP-independent transporter DctM subunit
MTAGLSRWPRDAARILAIVGGVALVAVSVFTVVDALLRWIFTAPIPGSNEIFETVVPIAVGLFFPISVLERSHLSVDFLESRLPARVKSWLLTVAGATLLFVFLLIAIEMTGYASDVSNRNISSIMLGIPVGPVFIALAVAFSVTAALQLFDLFLRVGESLTLHGEVRLLKHLSVTVAFLVGIAAAVWLAEAAVPPLAQVVKQDPVAVTIGFFLVLWIMLLILIPLGPATMIVGLFGSSLIVGVDPARAVVKTEVVDFLTNSQVATLPLFIIMGSFAVGAGLAEDIFRLAEKIFAKLRGGLALASIAGCAGFGAVTGSSLATSLTIGNIAIPEMNRRGYTPSLSTGCIAAGGTLGQLVPPSTALILYALLTETSIGQLFVGAVIPAAIAVLFYLVAVGLTVRLNPAAAPERLSTSIGEVVSAAKGSWVVVAIVLMVIGGIYTGVLTVVEAACFGVVATFAVMLIRKHRSVSNIVDGISAGAKMSAVVYALIFGGVVFSFFVGVSGVTASLLRAIEGFDVAPLVIIALILVVYIALGTVMESFGVLLITIPIVIPIIEALGYDLVWWGIIMLVVVETGMITPPLGLNVYVLRSITPEVPLGTVFKGVMPFVLADLVKLVILVLIPQLVLWLPSTIFR